MGNTLFRGKRYQETEKYGQIFVDTNHRAYPQGGQVSGSIHVNLLEPFKGATLALRVKGVELVHFVESESRIRTRSDGTQETYYETVLRTDRKYTLNYELPVQRWGKEEVLEAGHYTFPYSFKLPSKLSASFFQRIGRALAVVNYKVEAALKPIDPSHAALKCKQRFVVKPEGQQFKAGVDTSKTTHFSACCISRGENTLTCKFVRPYSLPGEDARLEVKLDNSRSQARCSKIVLTLRQHLDFRVQGRSKSYIFDVVTRELSGAMPGEVAEVDTASLQLPARQSGDYLVLKASGCMKDVLAKEQTFSNAVAPSTDGALISSRHILNVTALMEGCGAEHAQVNLPCYISLPDYEIPNTAEQPEAWQPRVYEPANLVLAPEYTYVKNVENAENRSNRQEIGSTDLGNSLKVMDEEEKKGFLEGIDLTSSVTMTKSKIGATEKV